MKRILKKKFLVDRFLKELRAHSRYRFIISKLDDNFLKPFRRTELRDERERRKDAKRDGKFLKRQLLSELNFRVFSHRIRTDKAYEKYRWRKMRLKYELI